MSSKERVLSILSKSSNSFPWRRKVRGTAPGMNNIEVNSRDKMGDSYWVWPKKVPTERHEQMMIARAAEIGTRTVFENFMFTFGGKNYVQAGVAQ